MPYLARFNLRSAVLLFGFTAALCTTAPGQDIYPKPKPFDPNLREVALVRQDFSNCENGDVSPSGYVGGTVWVVRGADGTTTVKVGVTAQRNTKYHFFLKCVRILGDIQTYEEGVGEGVFSFKTNEVGNVFAFDMYPEGAPTGNKYQSVQVKY
jgi:hypothetical protein